MKPSPFFGPAMQELTVLQRGFVTQLLLGDDDTRGVQYKAYLKGGYKAKNINTAYVAASMLMTSPKIKAAIAEVQATIDQEAVLALRNWKTLAVKAQSLLDDALDGRIQLTTNRLQSILAVLDRALGKPVQRTEKEVGQRLDQLIRDLAAGDNNGRPAEIIGEATIIEEDSDVLERKVELLASGRTLEAEGFGDDDEAEVEVVDG